MFRLRPSLLARPVAPMLFILAAWTGHAGAAILTVGAPSSGCNHTSVQAAVNAAQATPGGDTIRISRSAVWTAQQININTDSDIELIGGYPTCGSSQPSGPQTELNGVGGDARPVITIRGNGIFRLRNLTIKGGDQAGNDNGGGISFEGGGILDIADTAIIENSARNGGGIYATGTTLQAELVLGANVTVGFNTARDSGGGVFAKDIEMSLRGPGSSLMFNVAEGQDSSGRGGGLVVLASSLKAYAYISSNGIGGIGAIYANEAVDGGGIAVLGGVDGDDEAVVSIYSTDGANPVRINANTASSRGGAIYARPEGATFGCEFGCFAHASARLWYVDLTENQAADGAAVFVDFDNYGVGDEVGGSLSFNLSRPPDAVPCPVGRACGSISGNIAGTDTGSIVEVTDGSTFDSTRLQLQDNVGGRLIDMPTPGDDYAYLALRNSLVTGNDVAQELIRAPDDSDDVIVHLYHLTIADNTIGAPHALFVNDRLEFINSLVAQPGKATLAAGTDELQIVHVLTNDVSNLPAGPAAVAAPRFVDPANGNYRLRAGSRAVDYAGTNNSETIDGVIHNIDVPVAGIAAPARTADVGAYERPTLLPLVLNPDFDADLRLWDAGGSATWDGSQNTSGPAGSGSLQSAIGLDDFVAIARSQCIHLPGPGTYYLNGHGRVTQGAPSSNAVRLDWDLRHNGGAFGCTEGEPDLQGTHVLAQGPNWRRPPVDDVIEVSAEDWTPNTSLTIHLVVVNGNPVKGLDEGSVASLGGPTGWFDGITLGIEGDDTIFADGFE